MKYNHVDIEQREYIAGWLNRAGLTGAAAEIGCAFGGFAREVLQGFKGSEPWKGQVYYMVDPWVDQPLTEYKEKHDNVNYNTYWTDVQRLAKEDNRVRLMRDFSVPAADSITDGSLDFIHIDANHDFEHVTQDMDVWWPKLKSGGVFSGDDYYNDTIWPNYNEVKRAVDKWMADRSLTFTVCRRPAWWCVKP